MIKLDYKFTISNNILNDKINYKYASKEELLYDLFLGDIYFNVDDKNFDANWGWIPILDFGRSFFFSVLVLKNENKSIFEFTESGDEIILERKKDKVKITTTYVKNIAYVDFNDLKIASLNFAEKILSNLLFSFSELKNNIFIKEFSNELKKEKPLISHNS